MNNAFLSMEEPDITPDLRQREGKLTKIIEAFNVVSQSEEWRTLKTELFDGVVESLQRRMVSESNQMPLNEKEIYKLQGQIAWAKKYSNLDTLTQAFRLELQNIRKNLKPGGGAP